MKIVADGKRISWKPVAFLFALGAVVGFVLLWKGPQ